MRDEDLGKLAEGTKEAGYIVDSAGRILAWNTGAEKLTGVTAADAVGQFCHRIINSVDEGGTVCSDNCFVKQALQHFEPMESFEVQAQTLEGRKWCSVTVILVRVAHSPYPYAFHILRPIEVAKRLELAIREFFRGLSNHDPEHPDASHSPAAAVRQVKLSRREIEVLKLLAAGRTTKGIAIELGISTLTVNNHVRNIFRKLDAHNRLSAIRKAESAGLL